VSEPRAAAQVADRIAPYVTGADHACAPGEPDGLLERLSAPGARPPALAQAPAG